MTIIQYLAWHQALKSRAYLIKVPEEVVRAVDELLRTTDEYKALEAQYARMQEAERGKPA